MCYAAWVWDAVTESCFSPLASWITNCCCCGGNTNCTQHLGEPGQNSDGVSQSLMKTDLFMGCRRHRGVWPCRHGRRTLLWCASRGGCCSTPSVCAQPGMKGLLSAGPWHLWQDVFFCGSPGEEDNIDTHKKDKLTNRAHYPAHPKPKQTYSPKQTKLLTCVVCAYTTSATRWSSVLGLLRSSLILRGKCWSTPWGLRCLSRVVTL